MHFDEPSIAVTRRPDRWSKCQAPLPLSFGPVSSALLHLLHHARDVLVFVQMLAIQELSSGKDEIEFLVFFFFFSFIRSEYLLNDSNSSSCLYSMY